MKREIRSSALYRLVLYPLLVAGAVTSFFKALPAGAYVGALVGPVFFLTMIFYLEVAHFGDQLIVDEDTLTYKRYHGLMGKPITIRRQDVTRVAHWRRLGTRMPHLAVFTRGSDQPAFTIKLAILAPADLQFVMDWLGEPGDASR